jgi:hypothetical protein
MERAAQQKLGDVQLHKLMRGFWSYFHNIIFEFLCVSGIMKSALLICVLHCFASHAPSPASMYSDDACIGRNFTDPFGLCVFA